MAGLTFALAASPCSTPVLATLLGYVAASRVFGLVKFWGNWYFEKTGEKDQKENKNTKEKEEKMKRQMSSRHTTSLLKILHTFKAIAKLK